MGDGVFLGLCEAVFLGELNRRHNMCDEGREQKDPNDPKDGPEVMQKFCICIDPVLPNIDLKVSKQMPENIQYENQRGNRHDKLFAYGGLVKGNQRVIGELPDRNSWPSRSGHDSQLLKSLERCQSC